MYHCKKTSKLLVLRELIPWIKSSFQKKIMQKPPKGKIFKEVYHYLRLVIFNEIKLINSKINECHQKFILNKEVHGFKICPLVHLFVVAKSLDDEWNENV